MGKNFIGNLGSKKLHSIAHADGRCKINAIKEENKVCFITYEEGMNYPSIDRKIFAPCAICIPKYKASIEKVTK